MKRDGPKDPGAAVAPAVTDQAITKIKDLILTGEFRAGSKLPREQDLAQKLGLSRNSLREAVRALALVGVLESRVGDGTYVTSLDADLLMTGMGFVGELLDGKTLLEAHKVRRILEPVATGLAAARLTEADLAELAGEHVRAAHDVGRQLRCLRDRLDHDAVERTLADLADDQHAQVLLLGGRRQREQRAELVFAGLRRAGACRTFPSSARIPAPDRRRCGSRSARLPT